MPSWASLPADVLLAVVAFIPHPAVLAKVGVTCKALLSCVHALPRWHASGLVGGETFQGAPVPIARALHILLRRRCELCGRRMAHASFRKGPFLVFAHDHCLIRQLIPLHCMTRNQMPRVQAARVPTIPLRRDSYAVELCVWKGTHACVDDVLTVEGVETLSVEEAAARGDAHWARHALWEDASQQACARSRQRIEEQRVARLARLQRCTQERRAALSAALRTRGFPDVTDLEAAYGCDLIAHESVLGDYLAQRMTAPYSIANAVLRVREFIQFINGGGSGSAASV